MLTLPLHVELADGVGVGGLCRGGGSCRRGGLGHGVIPLFDELGGYLGEQGQTQYVLLALGDVLVLGLVLLQLRLQQVGGTA